MQPAEQLAGGSQIHGLIDLQDPALAAHLSRWKDCTASERDSLDFGCDITSQGGAELAELAERAELAALAELRGLRGSQSTAGSPSLYGLLPGEGQVGWQLGLGAPRQLPEAKVGRVGL